MDCQEWTAFLDAVCRWVRFKGDHKAIRQELTDHLEDMTSYLQGQGWTEGAAQAEALRRMGDSREIGQALDQVHKPWLGWLYRATTIALLLCLLPLVFLAGETWTGWRQDNAAWTALLPGPEAREVAVDASYPLDGLTITVQRLWLTADGQCLLEYAVTGEAAVNFWGFNHAVDDAGQRCERQQASGRKRGLGRLRVLEVFQLPDQGTDTLRFVYDRFGRQLEVVVDLREVKP